MKINPLLLSKLYALLKRLGIFVTIRGLTNLFTNHQPEMALNEQITQLIFENLDFANDAVEAALEGVVTSAIGVSDAARAIEALDLQGEDAAVAEGVVKLASTFGTVFGNLSPDQRAEVTDTVAKIVTGPNEGLIETLFNQCVALIADIRAANEIVDANTVTPDGE